MVASHCLSFRPSTGSVSTAEEEILPDVRQKKGIHRCEVLVSRLSLQKTPCASAKSGKAFTQVPKSAPIRGFVFCTEANGIGKIFGASLVPSEIQK